jgi:hypothetical protein
MKNAAIFVEGYQDRAFVSQWLELQGVQRAAKQQKGGIFAKLSRSGAELWIVPTSGTSGLRVAFTDFVAARGQDFDDFVVINDADTLTAAEAEARIFRSLTSAVPPGSSLSVVCWAPRLEGVIEQGLRLAYPNRVPSIDQFLAARVDAPAISGKELAHAYGRVA